MHMCTAWSPRLGGVLEEIGCLVISPPLSPRPHPPTPLPLAACASHMPHACACACLAARSRVLMLRSIFQNGQPPPV